MRLQKLFWIAAIVLSGGLLYVGVAEAHAGGKMQVASMDAGVYKLTVWTSPNPAYVGQVHVATAVVSAEDALPVLDASVFVNLVPQSLQGEGFSKEATTDDSVNKFLYESIFDITAEDTYQVTVTVNGADGNQGEVTFDLEVVPGPPLFLVLAALVVLGIVTGGAVWFYLRATSPTPQDEEVDEFDAVSA
ncbi:MAG: hypothetical protein WAM60_12240 [Candidatus Promineifilaceae bacterium]